MFVLLVAGGKVEEDIIDPHSLFSGAGYHFAMAIAGDIHTCRAMQTFSQHVRIGVGDDFIVLVCDENIPFAIHALRRIIIVERRFPPLGIVEPNRLLNHGDRVTGAVGLRELPAWFGDGTIHL